MERFDVKMEIKSEVKDESVYTENQILSLIKVEPKEDDDDNHKKSISSRDTHVEKSNNTQMKNNSCIWPCTSFEADVLKTEVKNNIVKEEPEDFSNEEYEQGLIQDSKIEITECDLKNESDNFSTVEKVKTETVLEDGTKNIYQCNTCDFISIYESNLKRHCQVHTDERPFQCQTCDKKFKTKWNLDNHIVFKHPENKEMMDNVNHKINKCNLCEYETISITSFKVHVLRHERHIQHHTIKRGFPCQICDKTYSRKVDLESHIVSIHSENKKLMDLVTSKINKCSICEYKTISSSYFKIHLQRHKDNNMTMEPTFECDICGHKTLVKKDLIRHIQVHTSKRS